MANIPQSPTISLTMKMLYSLFLLSSLATICHSLDAPPTQFVLSSTGPATKFKGHALGLYTKNTDTGYYEQEGGDYYLLEERRGWWFAFPHISGCDRKKQWSCIARWAGSLKTKNLTGNTWLFGKGEDWQEDPTIQFAPLDPASCLHCPLSSSHLRDLQEKLNQNILEPFPGLGHSQLVGQCMLTRMGSS